MTVRRKGKGRKAASKSIRQLLREGRPPKQAIAIAMRKAGLSRPTASAAKKPKPKKPRNTSRPRTPRQEPDNRYLRQYLDAIGKDVLTHQERLHRGISGRAGRRGL